MYDPKRGYPSVAPYLLYEDRARATQWLTEVLGMTEALRHSMPDAGNPGHVELLHGDLIVMLGAKGSRFGEVSSITLVFVDNVDATCERAVVRGGRVIEAPVDQPWGLRQAVVADPEGQRWEVTEHLRDAPAAEWGAQQLGEMPG
ncbi:MAG: hypothetical protein GEU80_00910 [Dehalococcoidia bacterium]|nr:hypothetical protein [Dehalococcoidia bacterium]